ncbi:MAG TPA: nucleotide exchange factor GrpE [Alphaproteobacteria bacterium]|nr:nucleotide exchange factor GrpE [Alphaproteobacteria bacterium]
MAQDRNANPMADEADPELAAVEAVERAVDEAAAREQALAAEVAELKDQLLRALAEVENVRRRGQKERDDASKYAIANFAREIVTVVDNLRRAIEAVPAQALATDENLKNLLTGVELTERALLAALERFGIKRIDPLGERFDHNLHQAMMQVDDPTKPAGTVVQVMQSGYVLHDRLLRPAMVAVSKGGPAAAPQPAGVDTTA